MQGKSHYNHRRISSDNITKLSKGEIFVFGSNNKGLHISGAAAYATEHFGAQWGVGMGMTGKCYAIPTMCSMWELKKHVQTFTKYASWHPEKIFLVTKIGCGIAGYTVEQIAPLFRPCTRLNNVYLPAEFFNYY